MPVRLGDDARILLPVSFSQAVGRRLGMNGQWFDSALQANTL